MTILQALSVIEISPEYVIQIGPEYVISMITFLWFEVMIIGYSLSWFKWVSSTHSS